MQVNEIPVTSENVVSQSGIEEAQCPVCWVDALLNSERPLFDLRVAPPVARREGGDSRINDRAWQGCRGYQMGVDSGLRSHCVENAVRSNRRATTTEVAGDVEDPHTVRVAA